MIKSIKELSLFFDKDISEDINFFFKHIVDLYYIEKREFIRDYSLKVFNNRDRTKKIKSIIKLCLKENKSLKSFWGGF